MSQIVAAWTALPLRRRVIVTGATLFMFVAVLAMARMSAPGESVLLYSGLDPVAAGQALGALDQRGVSYSVRGSAIYVNSGDRDALRMSLAGEGLPASGAQGYELLDTLSGFSTTSQMFDAAYWRAKEGELARTILSNPDVRSARVHISALAGRPFQRDFKPSASVAITTSGATVSPDFARAIRFLVAAAVADLRPENVSVMDSRSGVIIGADKPKGTDPAGKAAELKQNVERLLEARVGPGRAVVEVSVEVMEDTETILERKIDPASRVQISTETEERVNNATDAANPNVTVASNLPAGDGAAGGRSTSQATETRERINFEVSETTREVLRGPGAIQRITVAVLVDGIRSLDAAGQETWEPRPQEELSALRDLVASAVGYSESRQDSITIKSMQFVPPPELGTLADAASAAGLPIDLQLAMQLAALAVVAIVLGLFVVRPALVQRAGAPAGLPAPAPSELAALAAPTRDLAASAPIQVSDSAFVNAIGGPTEVGFPLAQPAIDQPEPSVDPVARLRALIAERREETVEILRSWIEEPENAR